MKKILLSLVMVGSAFAYVNCTMCHNGSYKETLNNYTPKMIITMMNQYKNGQRSGTMSKFAAVMSEADIKDAANKYGKK